MTGIICGISLSEYYLVIKREKCLDNGNNLNGTQGDYAGCKSQSQIVTPMFILLMYCFLNDKL